MEKTANLGWYVSAGVLECPMAASSAIASCMNRKVSGTP